MKITAIHCRPLRLKKEIASQPSWLSESVIANPMSPYPRYAARRSSWTAPFGGLAVIIETDDGVQGLATPMGGRPYGSSSSSTLRVCW
ncbi:hypothetical protein [Dictyobacter kobayashii]|uniref:Mandelate racemase/muconate lactonizing enzyme N-terminal domain-containing protein n=1 Tax=Dictyobacter kobayashii TaxID=2014872 RepID=A0A402ARY6_9CHLR|nr:hypothetical protein [Dictyobacter kobayashii]GCE21868.1 hypothetical protein KDK_56680 [Dictyobacter kobayashii]